MKVHCRRYAIASRHCTLVERAKCLHCRRHARDGLYQLCVSANCQTAFGRNSYAIDGTVAGVIGDVYSGSERIRGIETRQQSEFFFVNYSQAGVQHLSVLRLLDRSQNQMNYGLGQ